MSLQRCEPCDPNSETPVSYYEYAPLFFLKHFDHEPSRNTLYKYLTNGYPVEWGGPYIEIPHYRKLKRPFTTIEAMDRLLTRIRREERRAGRVRPGRAAKARAMASGE